MWCVPKVDEAYEQAMEDVLETYEKPQDEQVPVVCLDEKLVELRTDIREEKRTAHGVRLQDYEYKRCGTANVFVMTEPKGGKHFACVTKHRTRVDFAEALTFLAAQYPQATTIHLVMDNLNTHTEKSCIERYGEEEGRALWARFTPHYTPKHASWLNQAEIVIQLFSRACLRGQRISSRTSLHSIAQQFMKQRTQDRFTIDWKWTRKDARKWIETYRINY